MGLLGREVKALVFPYRISLSVPIDLQSSLKYDTEFLADMGISALRPSPRLNRRIKGLHPLVLNVPDEHLDLCIPLIEIDVHPLLFVKDHVVLFSFRFKKKINHLNLERLGDLFQGGDGGIGAAALELGEIRVRATRLQGQLLEGHPVPQTEGL